jgi:hypothetical protein
LPRTAPRSPGEGQLPLRKSPPKSRRHRLQPRHRRIHHQSPRQPQPQHPRGRRWLSWDSTTWACTA